MITGPDTDELNRHWAMLYRLYDDADELLYVGISLSAIRRMSEHSQQKPWWPDVARISIERHPSRGAAAAAELSAIWAEVPRYNLKRPATKPPAAVELPAERPEFTFEETVELSYQLDVPLSSAARMLWERQRSEAP